MAHQKNKPMNQILWDKGRKLINRVFTGEVDLAYDLVHYAPYTITTDIAVTLKKNPNIGGSAEIRITGDGVHAPVFSSSFVKSGGSEDFDITASAINKIIFYYDGIDAFYSITIL